MEANLSTFNRLQANQNAIFQAQAAAQASLAAFNTDENVENANFYPIDGMTDSDPQTSEHLKERINAVEEAYRKTLKAMEMKKVANLIQARGIYKKDTEKLKKNAWRTESEIPGFDADSLDDKEFGKF